MLKIELSKLWKSQPFLIFISLILLSNMISLGYSQNFNPIIPASAYQSFQKKLSEIPNHQRYDYVENYYQTIKALEALEAISALSVEPQKNAYLIEDIQNKNPHLNDYQDIYEHQTIQYYTGQLESEVIMIENIYQEMKTIHNYPSFLQNIFEQSETISNISIFQNEDLYEQKKKEKTQKDYQQCIDISMTYELEKGICDALNHPVSHFLSVISVVMIVAYLILDEKEKGLLSFLKTMSKGHTYTIMIKCITLCISLGVIVMMMTLSQLLYMHMTCGLGDLTRSLQSLVSYQQCFLPLTIQEYLLVYMFVRWMILCCIGMIFLWLAVIIKNRYIYFMIVVGLFVLEFILYIFIQPLSPLYLFKYLNMIFLLQTDRFFQVYHLVNIFQQPITLQGVIIVFIILIGLLFVCFIMMTYQNQEDLSLHHQVFQFKTKQYISLSLFKQECFKILWLQKVFLFIIICFVFSYYQMTHIQVYPSYEEKIYMQYMDYLEGPLTDEKEAWILEEKQRYQDIHEEYQKINERYEQGEISQRDKILLEGSLENQLQSEDVFQDIYQTYQQMKENPHIQFIVPYTYQKLLFEKSWTLLPTILLVLLVILSLSHVYSYEYMNHMDCLIETSFCKRKVRYKKLIVSLLIIIIMFLVMFIPMAIPLIKVYGLSNIMVSIGSLGLTSMSSYPLMLMLIVHCCLKLLALFCLASVMQMFQIRLKNHLLALFLTVVLFVLPLLLSYAGFSFFDDWGLYPLLMNGLYFENIDQLLLSLGIYGIITVICCYDVLKKS